MVKVWGPTRLKVNETWLDELIVPLSFLVPSSLPPHAAPRKSIPRSVIFAPDVPLRNPMKTLPDGPFAVAGPVAERLPLLSCARMASRATSSLPFANWAELRVKSHDPAIEPCVTCLLELLLLVPAPQPSIPTRSRYVANKKPSLFICRCPSGLDSASARQRRHTSPRCCR